MQPIDAIRTAYPHPVKAGLDNTSDAYCVGGAICAFYPAAAAAVGARTGFPGAGDLAWVFQHINPCLTPMEAYSCAISVTVNNDHLYFDDAWAAANDALTHGHEGATS